MVRTVTKRNGRQRRADDKAKRVLSLIDGVSQLDTEHVIRDRGKIIFRVPGLSQHLDAFLQNSGITKSALAAASGMSVQTVNSLLDSDTATDSILFRLRIGVSALSPPQRQYEDWVELTGATSKFVDDAILAIKRLYDFIRSRNSLDAADGPLSPMERAELIAILEAMLAELRAPAVSRNRLKEVLRWVAGIGTRAATTIAAQELVEISSAAASALKPLVRELARKAGITLF